MGRVEGQAWHDAVSNLTVYIEDRVEHPTAASAPGAPSELSNNETFFVPSPSLMEFSGWSFNRYLYRPPDPPLHKLPQDLLFPLNPDINWTQAEEDVSVHTPTTASSNTRC